MGMSSESLHVVLARSNSEEINRGSLKKHKGAVASQCYERLRATTSS